MSFVVNMIPNVASGETNQDSEPNLAVDPEDPRRIAASAFTPDPMGGANAPIFVSVDGGNTWALNTIVPSQTGAATGDISVAFGHQGRLYAGILRIPGGLRLNILRTLDFTSPTLMTVLVDRTGAGVDQPFAEAARVFSGSAAGVDRVYVGNNDFNALPQSATVDVSLDGAAATPPPPANFQSRRIEHRPTSGQDWPPIRPAVHIDGTVYAAFLGIRAGGTDVVVVRDDNWAAGGTQFADLLEGGVIGQRVATGVTVPFENFQTMGMERLVASDLSIAVDPRDSNRVWVAWGDRPAGTTNLTLHVRHSTDRGQTWSADVRVVSNAKAPVLAVNSRGRVAFLYQQLTGTAPNLRWVTQVDRTGNDFASFTTDVLATVPANAPTPQFLPYLGDYMDMKSPGKDFCGVFSTSNTPDLANFPLGVTYQRNHNFGTKTLFGIDGTTPVNPSIDPFFFCLTELATDLDVYVADWTDSATSFDQGVEPSSEPVFYNRSDVWTRLANAPGAFDANNRPVNEPPQNGPGAAGNNFAFARIRRRATGSAVAVNTHFLFSPFGTGSNYQDLGAAPDIVVNLAPADAVITMAAGYPWHLDATSSTHLCLAVEISTADDPLEPPSLLGRAPGWPTTDLLVINDNNKAQRNMGVGPTSAGGWLSWYALIHNAATRSRDVTLQWLRTGPKPPRPDELLLIGTKPRQLQDSGQLVVKGLKPGEHRWVRLTLQSGKAVGKPTQVVFSEIVGNRPVNGFAVVAEPGKPADVSRYMLGRAASVYTRAAAFGVKEAEKLAAQARKLVRQKAPEKGYPAFAKACQGPDVAIMKNVLAQFGKGDPFGLDASHKAFVAAVKTGSLSAIQSNQGAFLEGIDAILTTVDKRSGDLGDVCQNVRWQADLFGSKKLAGLRTSKQVVEQSRRFVDAFGARKATVADYPALVAKVDPGLQAAAKALKSDPLLKQLAALEEPAAKDPKTMQQRHWQFLDTLAGLVGA